MCAVAGIFHPSQKVHQEWAPVCRPKCEGFQRKMKDFRCVRLLGFLSRRRKCTKSGPKYGEQNVRNFARKLRNSGVLRETRIRRICTKSGPKYGEQDVRNFVRKLRISGVNGVEETRILRICTKTGPRYGEQNVRNFEREK